MGIIINDIFNQGNERVNREKKWLWYFRVWLFSGAIFFILWVILEENGGSYFEYLGTITPYFYMIGWKYTYESQLYIINKLKHLK